MCRPTALVAIGDCCKSQQSHRASLQELAVRYFPDVLPASATRHLTRLICGDGELLNQLTQIGYKRGCRIYTPAMVHLIVRYLGLPQHYIFAED